jgi:hypothetical protein
MRIQHDLSDFTEVPPITLYVAGDLLITGWDRKFIEADTDEEDPDVVIDDDQIHIDTSGDLRIQLPTGANLSLDVGGNVHVRGSRSAIQINALGGDINIEDALSVEFKNIGGDLRAVRTTSLTGRSIGGSATVDETATVDIKDVAGDLTVRRADTVSSNVAGDAMLYEIAKAVAINASGDLKLMACHGDVAGNASGNVQIEVLGHAPQIRVNANSDIRCILGEAVGAKVRVVCGSDLRVTGAGSSQTVEGRGVHTFHIGEGEGSISLVAESEVIVTAQGVIGGLRSVNKDMTGMNVEMDRLNVEMERLGREMESMGIDLGREFGTLGDRIAEAIGSKLRSKLEKSMRKAAIKAQAKAGKRGFSFEFDIPTPPTPPTPPRSPRPPFAEENVNEPVSDEERMMVLRMVEEGKITADEAERLIAALEGDHEG